jgi:pteridine reductase
MDLKGRVVLVTGGARRVGRAIALRLAEAGCSIAVHYATSRREAEETVARCREKNVEAEAFIADLAQAPACTRLVGEVLARFGRLDILVNNASTFETMTLDDFDVEKWDHTLRVNLTAPMALVHAARESLRANRGRVINLCDIATQRPWPDHLAYITSKGALETLTRALARALAPEVNVVGIAPGVAAWPDHYDEATRSRLLARVPLRRSGAPEDVAHLVHFLLREGDYITGAILPIDGGRHVV